MNFYLRHTKTWQNWNSQCTNLKRKVCSSFCWECRASGAVLRSQFWSRLIGQRISTSILPEKLWCILWMRLQKVLLKISLPIVWCVCLPSIHSLSISPPPPLSLSLFFSFSFSLINVKYVPFFDLSFFYPPAMCIVSPFFLSLLSLSRPLSITKRVRCKVFSLFRAPSAL